MKRLITLIGAAALGFAAFADAALSPLLNKVENFEGFNVGDKITNATSYAENSTVVYPWSLATDADEESATIAGDDSNKYIALETDTRKPLCRAINNREASTAALTPADIGDGIFLDAKVKFTCAEEAAEIGEGTKLCIWAKQTEAEDAVGVEGEEGYVPAVEAATNLIVTAGGALTAFADVTKTDYELNLPANFDFSAWHRVTVRAIKNVTKLADAAVTGFVVFIDENPVAVQGSAEDYAAQIFNGFDETNLSSEGKKFFDARQLFVSLVKTGASGSTELSYMGFAGSGAADNIAICDKDGAKTICQFAIGQQTFTITIASAITDFSWQANDGVSSGTKATIKDGTITVDGSATMITFTGLTVSDSTKYSVKGATGGTLVVDLTALEAPTIELAVDTIAFIVNNKPFSSFENAFAEALTSGKPMILNAPFTMAQGQTIGGDVAQSIVLDLNGETLTYDCTNLEEALFTVVANGTFQIIDSKGNGKLTWNKDRTLDSTPKLVSVVNGDMIMGALTGDAGATIDGVFMDNAVNPEDPEFASGNGSTIIYKGFFDYNSNLYVSEDDPPVTDFYSALVVSKDSAYAANEDDTLWVVTPKAAPVGTKPFAIIIAGETETTTNYYDTLEGAIAAAGTEGLPSVVTILENVTIENKVLISKKVTLDATGKTVTCAAMYPFFVKGGDLTITGGTFTQNVVDGIILWAKDGGKITVNGGDFSAIPDGEIAYVSTADALIKIYGGKFVMADKADGSKGDVLNVAQTLGLNKTDYIQVYGGSFSKDPAEGDDALGPTFVANGYASVKQDNGLWKVGAAIIATFKVDDAIVKAETNIVAFTPVAPTNPSKEGYTFTGWTPAVDEITESTVFVAQFEAEETKVDPEQPIPVPAEKTPEQVAEQMNTKGIANYLKVPTVVTDAAAYTAMFAAKADGNTVIIALKPTVEAEIKAELANTATSGSMLNPDATTSEVTITARPGLFYGIKAVGDVTTIGTANGQNWVQASGDTVNVVRPTVSGNAAFFQAVCSPKAPPANN